MCIRFRPTKLNANNVRAIASDTHPAPAAAARAAPGTLLHTNAVHSPDQDKACSGFLVATPDIGSVLNSDDRSCTEGRASVAVAPNGIRVISLPSLRSVNQRP